EKAGAEAGVTEEPAEITPEEIVSQMQERQEALEDYSCTIHAIDHSHAIDYNGDGETGEIPESRKYVMYKTPDLLKSSGKGFWDERERLAVADGEYYWEHEAGSDNSTRARIREGVANGDVQLRSFIEYIPDENQVTLLDMEELEGRPSYLLELRDPGKDNESRPQVSTKLWVDKENLMPLRYEIYDNDGNLSAEIEILDLKVNRGIPDSEFVFEVPEGGELISTATFRAGESGKIPLEDIREQARFEVLLPEYLPEGYAFMDSRYRSMDETGTETPATGSVFLTFVLKEESKLIVLSETGYEGELRETSLTERAEKIMVNGREGWYLEEPGDPEGELKRLKWKIGDVELSLLASVEKAELLKIAESISAKE
ncbi:MAG: DUF4367 domain-containing protein, partial [Methanosarcinaceae archaeon]|nr:DUF4367 domain-containing protein [Methanosarcinaceae archaeon]